MKLAWFVPCVSILGALTPPLECALCLPRWINPHANSPDSSSSLTGVQGCVGVFITASGILRPSLRAHSLRVTHPGHPTGLPSPGPCCTLASGRWTAGSSSDPADEGCNLSLQNIWGYLGHSDESPRFANGQDVGQASMGLLRKCYFVLGRVHTSRQAKARLQALVSVQ